MLRYQIPLIVATLALPNGLLAQNKQASSSPTIVSLADGFAEADRYADATPERAERSISTLAAYLAGAGTDDLTRARVIYRWITGNIDYDVAGFRSGSYGDLSPDGVLHRRAAVCTGYAQIAEALGEAMGLEMEVVNGWSKGYGYTAGQRFDGPVNHAWNAVRIDGEWQLMDPTWGSGYLNQEMSFTRRFQGHYFLTEPGAFVFAHLPEDSRWQLLDDPITSTEYSSLAHLQPMFFQLGLQLKTHDRILIETGNRLSVKLGITMAVQISAQLLDADSERTLERDRTFVQISGSEARVDAVFPEAGEYILRLFAKPLGAEGSLRWVLDYRVEASQGLADAGFPTVYGNVPEQGVVLAEPLDGRLDAGQTYHFRLSAPGALQVALVADGDWTYFTGEGTEFSAEVTAVRGAMTVYAKYDPEEQFLGLLQYTGR